MTEFTWAKFIHRYHITTPSLLVIYKTETLKLPELYLLFLNTWYLYISHRTERSIKY